jgi:predicted RNA binding protein YcfA (HicA-like mRNA interferase family)
VLPGEIDGRRFIRAMARFGWTVARARGSHRVLTQAPGGRILVVAFHKTLSRNSVRRALREPGIDEKAFQDEL